MGRKQTALPECECCGKPAAVLMEIGRWHDDWMILECDQCGSTVCRDCADQSEMGEVVCVLCLQTEAMRNAL